MNSQMCDLIGGKSGVFERDRRDAQLEIVLSSDWSKCGRRAVKKIPEVSVTFY